MDVPLAALYYKAVPLGPFTQAATSPYAPSLRFDAAFLIILLSPNTFSLFNAFFPYLNTFIFPGQG